MPVEVHDVIEIARPCSFAQRPQLLTERFFIGIGRGPQTPIGTIAVGMKNFATYGGKDKFFIRRQIELDLRPAAAPRRHRPPVSDLSLTGRAPARVLINIESELL